MFRNDFLLDMVEALGRNIGKALFDEEEEGETLVIESSSDKDMLVVILKRLISIEKYNAAENTLFDFVALKKYEDLEEVGEWFYNELSLITDEKLLKNNFSREEIEQGLNDFRKLIG